MWPLAPRIAGMAGVSCDPRVNGLGRDIEWPEPRRQYSPQKRSSLNGPNEFQKSYCFPTNFRQAPISGTLRDSRRTSKTNRRQTVVRTDFIVRIVSNPTYLRTAYCVLRTAYCVSSWILVFKQAKQRRPAFPPTSEPHREQTALPATPTASLPTNSPPNHPDCEPTKNSTASPTANPTCT